VPSPRAFRPVCRTYAGLQTSELFYVQRIEPTWMASGSAPTRLAPFQWAPSSSWAAVPGSSRFVPSLSLSGAPPPPPPPPPPQGFAPQEETCLPRGTNTYDASGLQKEQRERNDRQLNSDWQCIVFGFLVPPPFQLQVPPTCEIWISATRLWIGRSGRIATSRVWSNYPIRCLPNVTTPHQNSCRMNSFSCCRQHQRGEREFVCKDCCGKL